MGAVHAGSRCAGRGGSTDGRAHSRANPVRPSAQRLPGGPAIAGPDGGEIERARAVATLAVAAAADHGFTAEQTDYAVTVAKVVLPRVVRSVITLTHQLHGAIGSTLEHRLWLSTMRAQSWISEFGSTGHYARRLARMAVATDDPWDVVIGQLT